MKNLLPSWCWPLNIMHIHGTMCCQTFYHHYQENHFKKFAGCFNAPFIHEANMLVLWGSPSDKLAMLVQTRSTPMLQNRFIIHMRGCHEYTTHPSHLDSVSINWIFSGCNPTKSDYHTLINEARRCLRV